MKKTFTILIALMVLCFTQCKPTPEGGDANGSKVKVSCTIPINDGGKSDFTNLMEDGRVNWSTGTERVYLAIPNETSPQIVELTAFTTLQASELAFEGEVEEGLLEEGKEYEVWYLGNSKNLDVPYVTETKDGDLITKVSGSISEQSGELEDLGLYHIAKVSVTAVEEEGEIVLPLRGVLKSQIAIAYLDLEGVDELSGSAVKGTEYSIQYNGSTNKYDFVVTENPSSTISVTSGTATSFIVLLPNESNNVILKSSKGGYEFKKGVEGNKFYYRYISNVEKGTLRWAEIEDEPSEPDQPGDSNDHSYVDLGLSVKWATCNVGATSPEEYGNYYAWGETTTKTDYSSSTSATYGLSYSSLRFQGYIDNNGNLTAQHDAATANWGGDWRMPTKAEQQELLNNCTWTWTTQNGVNGYKVSSKVNSNYIFLPAAGSRDGSSLSNAGSLGYYWSSTPHESSSYYAYYLRFNSSGQSVSFSLRYHGQSVRPVCGGGSSTPSDETITVNGVSFKMIAVEGGTFKMGATSEQGSDYELDELPVHSVTLSSYSIGETEVTQELWEAVMGSNPSYFPGYPQRPVEYVTWNDCQTFITKLNQLTGRNFRLPTEAEWEYAARGGSKSQGYKYSGSNTIGDVAWYSSNSNGNTHDVKTKAANELGIYDMSGNVSEWCQDWYSKDYYSSSPEINPTGPSSGSYRVNRGGGMYNDASGSRVSKRGNGSPSSTSLSLGLRLCLSYD